jgi:hypothetical protein
VWGSDREDFVGGSRLEEPSPRSFERFSTISKSDNPPHGLLLETTLLFVLSLSNPDPTFSIVTSVVKR